MHKNKMHDEFQVLTILISAVPVLWWFEKEISSGNTTACFSFRVYVHNNIKLLILLMLKLSNAIKTSTEDSFWETCYAAPRRNVFMRKILAS